MTRINPNIMVRAASRKAGNIWICRDLVPDAASAYAKNVAQLMAANEQGRAAQAANAFQDRVLQAIDKMFGSVTAKDVAEGLAAQGFTIDRRKIQLPHPIKELGTVTVPVKMPRDVTATVTVRVVKKQEPEPAQS